PLPLVALQAVLLALVALGSVGASVAEQRRPDVALARLRGRRPLAAAATVVGDLALVSVLGCLLGGLAGWALARVVAAWWLPDDVPLPLDGLLLLAVAAAAALAVVTVVVTAAPSVREPLTQLLRSVPPRGSAVRAGLLDGLVVALAAAGLVSLLTGDAASPDALLAPGLLALAG
ncbi:FtsX-like permease family protein, partial [Angustibacter aerolatus]